MKKGSVFTKAGVLFFALALVLGMTPLASAASSDDLEVSGWVPYWAGKSGPRDARKHLDELTAVYPFAYSVASTGELKDLAGLGKSDWKRLIREAKKEDVLVIPTAMSSDGALLHTLLSDKKKRANHIEEIVDLVEDEDFDGIDIDYENKLAETKDHFSLFLKELRAELDDDKKLTCTVEARTPPDSLFRTPPAVMQYANDYKEMAKHCDWIEIMAYDQQRADIKLNDARRGAPYMPLSDLDWVEKVVKHALLTIPKDKIVLGIPTYGHEYQVLVSPNWYQSYTRVRALNPDVAEDLAEDKDVTSSRNNADEMSFTYAPNSTTEKLLKKYKAPKNTPKWNIVGAQALAYANATGKSVTINMVSWSDAGAIEDKIDLAKEYDLRGVAIFKFDGEEDPDMWDVIEDR